MWIYVLAMGTLALVACARADAPTDDPQKREQIEALYTKYKQKFPQVEDVTASQLAERLGDPDLVLVDVRTDPEREVSIIAGAITSEAFEASGDQYRDRTVVTYCTAGYRSGLYADKLRRDGWEVLNLAGSLLSWTHAGQPLVKLDGSPTQEVHVFGPQWNLVAEGYDGTW